MALFEVEKMYGRVFVKIFGINISFVMHPKIQNYYISLGQNCFVRTILTRYGIKAKRKQGELSCPFDLLLVPLPQIAKLLENNFDGLTSDLRHDCETDCWYNDNLQASFFHDKNLSEEHLKLRYQKRVENFKNLSNTSKELKYILLCQSCDCNVKLLNNINQSLKSYRQNKLYKLFVAGLSEKDEPDLAINPQLDKEIVFKQYKIPIPVKEFLDIWHLKSSLRGELWVKNLHKNFISDILNA